MLLLCMVILPLLAHNFEAQNEHSISTPHSGLMLSRYCTKTIAKACAGVFSQNAILHEIPVFAGRKRYCEKLAA